MSKRPKTAYRSNQSNQTALDINEIFIEACASGDYQTVNIILSTIKDFNIDVTDNLGRTALRLAVVNENLEVVASLLSKTDSQKLREALLLAIYIGHTQIAELILRHPQYKIFNDKKLLNGASDSFWQTPSSDDAQFSPDITPIMLASQYNRTEIVQMLLLNGDRIDKPHEYNCKCNECTNRFKFDSLRHAQSRLNAYRALASESYISLVSVDPILTAFEMGHELRYLSEKEKYFKNEYLILAEKLSEYTVKLLNNVRGRDELEIVLNKTGKENEEKYERFARLDLALKYSEMPFVAHPNCQQKLVEIWYSGIRKVTKMNPTLTLLVFACFIVCLPFLAISHIFVPNTKIGRLMVQPCIKFIAYTTSYIVLIGLVVISSLRFPSDDLTSDRFTDLYSTRAHNFTNYVHNENLTFRFQVNDFIIRDSQANIIDCFICLWLLALMVYEAKKLISYGLRNYLLSVSNIANVITYTIFIASFALKFYTIIKVMAELETISSDEFWNNVNNLKASDHASQIHIFQTFYWLNSDRYYWFSFDPINLSEAFYAIATALAFSKLCFFLPANQTLGPLQITLGRMITDIVKFIFIFMIIFVGFLFGLNNLYWYYKSSVRGQVEVDDPFVHSKPVNAELYFGSIDTTLKTMFFSIFLIGNYQAVLISPFSNNLTVIFGYIVFGLFHVSNITVLLNMLIAMMTRSYETILHHSDTEWKFSRSQLYMDFIKEEAILPVPFNLLPMPYSIAKLAKRFYNYVLRRNNDESRRATRNDIEMPQMSRNGNGHANGSFGASKSDSPQLTYKIVMQRVVKRFLLHNSREDDEAKESDFDEFKQDVQIARIEMLSDMKRSRENMLKYMMIVHTGISLLGDLAFDSLPPDLSGDIRSEREEDSETTSVVPLRSLVDEFKEFKRFDQALKHEMQLSLQSNALALRNQDFVLKNSVSTTSNASTAPNKSLDSNGPVSPISPLSSLPQSTPTIENISEKDTKSPDNDESTLNNKKNSKPNVVMFTDLNTISEESSRDINLN